MKFGPKGSPQLTPEQEYEFEAGLRRIDAEWERKQDYMWDKHCEEFDKRTYAEYRKQLKKEGKLLSYEDALDLALNYYAHGGDSFVECTERSDYELNPMTREELLEDFEYFRELWNQKQWNDSSKISPS